jgi:predicted NBD/HSP70 family sugar kinase
VNILNPARIIVSGEGAAAGEALLGPARAALRANAFGDLGERVDLVVAVAGDEEWARGAASLVVGEVFQPPVYATRPEHSAHLFERTPGRSAATDAGR